MPSKRKTRSGLKPSSNVNNNEPGGMDATLSSLKVPVRGSKPMLMIPQPVLRSHGLDTNMRMTRLESNAFVALGIKEEPEDVVEFQDPVSQIETDFNFNTPENPEGEKTSKHDLIRRSRKRKTTKTTDSPEAEDANNNRRRTRAMEREENKLQAIAKVVVKSFMVRIPSEQVGTEEESENQASLQADPILTETNRAQESEECQEELQVPLIIDSEPKVDDGAIKDTMEESVDPLGDLSCLKDSSELVTIKGAEKKSDKEKSDESTNQTDEEGQKEDAASEDEDFSESSDDKDDEFGVGENAEDIFPKLWVLKEEERRTLICGVCKKKFSRVSILTAHKKKHFDPNIYKCDHCDKVFSSESSYKHHIAYSGLAPYKCDKCGKSYYTEQKCEAHREQCEGKNTERKYNCEECGRSYMMLCSLRTHIRERHSDFVPVKNLCCELCGKRFRHRKYLDLHMYSHSTEKNFECDICHRRYKSSDILRHHVRMVHKNPPKVTCELCGKEVSRVSLKAHLNRHREKQEEEEESARTLLQLAESEDSPCCRICCRYFENDKLLEMHCCEGRDGTSFPCCHCSDEFQTAGELVKHTCAGQDNSKSRNSSKIYRCIFCGREYNCHTPFLYHVRHHTGDKPYPCTECDKSFRLKQGLKVHMRNHTGEKPFKCDKCPAAFKQKPFLLDHMNTHTGDKPYQCERCLARFSVRSALSTHKRIHRRELKGQR